MSQNSWTIINLKISVYYSYANRVGGPKYHNNTSNEKRNGINAQS